MNAKPASEWQHTTVKACPVAEPVGIDLFDEDGFFAIYNRYADGTRWPCRTVNPADPEHARIVMDSWTGKYRDNPAAVYDYRRIRVIGAVAGAAVQDIPRPDDRPEILQGLGLVPGVCEGDSCYRRCDLMRPGVEEHEIAHHTWLYFRLPQLDSVRCHFAVLRFEMGSGDLRSLDSLELLFAGEGISGNLRELRHLWFGRTAGGYLYLAKAEAMAAAFEFLKQHFD